MTAIVGILNKRAAVMAADSAVTLTHGKRRKIFNGGKKIFRLTERQPVGVMLFQNLEFMGTPWDVIFNFFLERRGMKEHGSLSEYVQEFIDFIGEEEIFMGTDTEPHRYIQSEIVIVMDCIRRMMDDEELKDEDIESDKYRQCARAAMAQFMEEVKKNEPCPDMESYTFKEFRQFAKDDLSVMVRYCYDIGIPAKTLRTELSKLMFEYLRNSWFLNGTGLVFCGYGTKEPFPSMITMYISGALDGKIRWYISNTECHKISNEEGAVIQPFAQDDVIETLINGISPLVSDYLGSAIQHMMDDIKQKMIEVAKENGVKGKALEALKEVDLSGSYDELTDGLGNCISENFVEGIIDAVGTFSVEEMATLADNFISITELQRNMTSSEESVGGPVRVAMLTRAEGFQWK